MQEHHKRNQLISAQPQASSSITTTTVGQGGRPHTERLIEAKHTVDSPQQDNMQSSRAHELSASCHPATMTQ